MENEVKDLELQETAVNDATPKSDVQTTPEGEEGVDTPDTLPDTASTKPEIEEQELPDEDPEVETPEKTVLDDADHVLRFTDKKPEKLILNDVLSENALRAKFGGQVSALVFKKGECLIYV